MRFCGTNEIISSPRSTERSPLSNQTVTVDRRLYHTAATAKKGTFYFIDGRAADHFPPRRVTHAWNSWSSKKCITVAVTRLLLWKRSLPLCMKSRNFARRKWPAQLHHCAFNFLFISSNSNLTLLSMFLYVDSLFQNWYDSKT